MFSKSKKTFLIIFVVFLLFLSGCINEQPNNDNNDDNTTNPNPSDDEPTILETISKTRDLIAHDIASEYIINSIKLTTYKYKEDPNVSYVNILEFIAFMDGGIVDLDILKLSDQLKISYTFDVPVEYQALYGESYTYEMTIDATSDTISFNDFDMISGLNVEMLTQYDTELMLSNMEFIEDDPALDIDLSLYDMDIVFYENNFYIPLYLANLFFTGSNINVYEMKDSIYIIDNFSDLTQLVNEFERDLRKSAIDLRSHTEKYLALYFDYFYGLKEFKNIETYKDVLNMYEFENKDDFHTLHKEVESFLRDQNDLHTSIVTGGYLNRYYTTSVYSKSEKLTTYVDAYTNNQCHTRTSEVDYTSFDNTLIIEVNGFSLETKDLLKPAMESAKNYDNVIIDVSCNPGGSLIGVVELLSYMTNEEIPVSYTNPKTGGTVTEYYQSTINYALEKNFYVYTSGATFSAANLFSSIVKDLELAVIFGENSSGGASAITYTVLPDGAIIVNSSNMTLINKNGLVIEDGILVDVEYELPINWDIVINDLKNMM